MNPSLSISNQITAKIIPMLISGDEADKCNASRFLGNLKSEQSVPLLIDQLMDEDIDVCIDAINALGEIGSDKAIPILRDALFDAPDGDVKTSAIKALTTIGGIDTKKIILQILSEQPLETDETDDWDPWWDIQLIAVKACGDYQITEAVPLLEKLLLEDDIQDIDNEIFTALVKIGNKAESLIIEQSLNPAKTRRRRAVKALVNFKSIIAAHAVLNRLKDKEPDVTIQSIESLSLMGSFEFSDAVRPFLSNINAAIRLKALQYFLNLGKVKPIDEILLKIALIKINDQDENVRQLAMQILYDLHRKGISIPEDNEYTQQLLTSCKSSHMSEAVIAIRLLETTNLELSRIKETLAELIHQSSLLSMVSIAAIESLASCQPTDYQTIFQLTKATEDLRQNVRNAAIKELVNLYHSVLSCDEDTLLTMNIDQRLLDGARSCLFTIARGDKLPDEPSIRKTEPEAEQSHGENTLNIKVLEIDSVNLESEDAPGTEVEQITEDVSTEGTEPLTEALSTLDAILLDNQQVESELNTPEKIARAKELPQLLKELPDDLQPFGQQLQQTINSSDRLGIKKKIAPGEDARLIAIRLLADIESPQIIDLFIALLSDNDEYVRKEAIKSIGKYLAKYNDVRLQQISLGPLISLLESSNPDLRLAALVSLSALRKKVTLPVFVEKLDDPDIGVKVQAIRSLIEVTTQGSDDKDLQGHLAEVDHEQLQKGISNALKDSDYSVQRMAISSIFPLQLPYDIEQLIELGVSQGGVLSKDVAYAMLKLAPLLAMQQLIEKLSTSDNSSERRYILDMLEVIYTKNPKEN